MLTINNRHKEDSPEFNTEDFNLKHFYFENEFNDQLVYVWNYRTRKAAVYCGDTDWKKHNVKQGVAKGLEADCSERMWVMACWFATGGIQDLKEKYRIMACCFPSVFS